jgi:hypothetical protein
MLERTLVLFVFYGLLTPLGILYRGARKVRSLWSAKNRSSYWIVAQKEQSAVISLKSLR